MSFFYAGSSVCILLLILLGSMRQLYTGIAEGHQQAARELGLNCRCSLIGFPMITGEYQGHPLRVELYSSHPFHFPDSIRVTLGNRIHRQFGLTLHSESLTGILDLLLRQQDSEIKPEEPGRIVRLQNGD